MRPREFMASSGYRNELCFYQHFAPKVSINAPRQPTPPSTTTAGSR
jgi:hypothetical protein